MIIINENKTKSISKLNRFQCYVLFLYFRFFFLFLKIPPQDISILF